RASDQPVARSAAPRRAASARSGALSHGPRGARPVASAMQSPGAETGRGRRGRRSRTRHPEERIMMLDNKVAVVTGAGSGIRTPLVEESMDEAALKALAGMHPLGRLGESREVAELCRWLA